MCYLVGIMTSGSQHDAFIVPSHGTDQGSIPWMRNKFAFVLNYLTLFFRPCIKVFLKKFHSSKKKKKKKKKIMTSDKFPFKEGK
jgi:hypothetical protein